MNLLLESLTTGIALALLLMAGHLSFRVFGCIDMTLEGSVLTGGVISVFWLLHGVPPALALPSVFAVGALAGIVTGFLCVYARIPVCIAGILTMLVLLLLNYRFLEGGMVNLNDVSTCYSAVEKLSIKWLHLKPVEIMGWDIHPRDMMAPLVSLAVLAIVAVLGYWLCCSSFGIALRAAGRNPAGAAGCGINPALMLVSMLALTNGLAAVYGALLVQYYGCVDPYWGIASLPAALCGVMLGEYFIRCRSFWLSWVGGAVLGALLLRLLLGIAQDFGFSSGELKIIPVVLLVIFLFVAARRGKGLRMRNAEGEYAEN